MGQGLKASAMGLLGSDMLISIAGGNFYAHQRYDSGNLESSKANSRCRGLGLCLAENCSTCAQSHSLLEAGYGKLAMLPYTSKVSSALNKAD